MQGDFPGQFDLLLLQLHDGLHPLKEARIRQKRTARHFCWLAPHPLALLQLAGKKRCVVLLGLAPSGIVLGALAFDKQKRGGVRSTLLSQVL